MDTPKRLYETTFIVNASLDDGQIDGVIGRICPCLEVIAIQPHYVRVVLIPIPKINAVVVSLGCAVVPQDVQPPRQPRQSRLRLLTFR